MVLSKLHSVLNRWYKAAQAIKFFGVVFCAMLLAAAQVYASSPASNDNGFSEISIRAGIFNSEKAARAFYEKLPQQYRREIQNSQLWLDVHQSKSGFKGYYLDISALEENQAATLCDYLEAKQLQCIVTEKRPFIPQAIIVTAQPESSARLPTGKARFRVPRASADLPLMLQPIGMRFDRLATMDQPVLSFELQKATMASMLAAHGDDFTLSTAARDLPQQRAAKEDYTLARDRLLSAVQQVGAGLNNGQGAESLKKETLALGQEAFEAAGNAYLTGLFEKNLPVAEALGEDESAGKAFVHHVKQSLAREAQSTVRQIMSGVFAGLSGGSGLGQEEVTAKLDSLMLSAAKSVIDSGLAVARRSDLYLLRHLELEYNLNHLEDAYFQFLGIQPVHQTADMRHNVFIQAGGILNEQSVDVDDDDTLRHTANLGLAYRHLTKDEKYLIGGNLFLDHQRPYKHTRMSLGVDLASAAGWDAAANYYIPLTGSQATPDGLVERALEGFDLAVGYHPVSYPGLRVFGKGYYYYRDLDPQGDLSGLEAGAEYNITDRFAMKGSLISENGGRNGVEMALLYRQPLYDVETPNLVAADMSRSPLRERIFEKVKRENRIRIEKTADPSASLTASFDVASIGLPFDVGGAFLNAGIELTEDVPITVPAGSFGIINFSNGAVANLSASGAGDVIVEFNATTLTVTQTGGGFVQFISGTGGISIVNVPGGTVNLLGTDIDVTDDGTTTTVQVRAGQIQVVPDVGVDLETGNQADIVSLTIASGATSLLADPALTTRREDAFTNLDVVNPKPAVTATAAPFVSALPDLITGPQFVGNNADIELVFSQPVAVTGAPFLNGMIDANARTFVYVPAASTSLRHVFRHVYLAGDVGAANVTIQDLDLNGGTITGVANSLTAITTYTTTVAAITDQTGPSVVLSSPTDNAVGVVTYDDIVLTFDENIAAGVGSIVIEDITGAGADTRTIPIGDAQVNIAGAVLTIDPAAILLPTNAYQIIMASGVVRDGIGNPHAGLAAGDLNFTTDAGDFVAPVLSSFARNTPAGPTTGDDTLVFRATFNENVMNVDATDFVVNSTSTATVTGLAVVDAQSYDVTVSGGDLASFNGTVGLDVAGGQNIEDLAGNAFAGAEPATDELYTMDNTAPVLGVVSPVDDATGVARNTTIVLNFDEDVALAGTIVLTDTDDASGDLSYTSVSPEVSIVNNVITITPAADLEYAENYEVTWAAGAIEDLFGNGAVALTSTNMNFRTFDLEDVLTLTVAATGPDGNIDENNVQGSGQAYTRNQDAVFAAEINIPAAPDGLIFEGGATGAGTWVGFNNGAGVLRLRGGEGAALPDTDGALINIPLGTIPAGPATLTWEYDVSLGQMRVWLDDVLIGTNAASGGSFEGGIWSGTDNFGYGATSSSVPTGEITTSFNGTLLSDLRYYRNQVLPP